MRTATIDRRLGRGDDVEGHGEREQYLPEDHPPENRARQLPPTSAEDWGSSRPAHRTSPYPRTSPDPQTAQYRRPVPYPRAQYPARSPDWTASMPNAARPYGGGGGNPPWPPAPDPAAEPARRKRRPLIIAIAVVVVVALLVGGGYAAWRLLVPQGASTPSEAVTLLAGAVEKKDLLGAYDKIAPMESALAGDFGTLLAGELVRLEVLRPDANPQALLDSITVSGLRFDEAAAEPVRDNVTITKLVAGTITSTQDPAVLPVTDSFKARAFPNGLPPAEPSTIDIAKVVADRGEPIRIATAKIDGAWYVSVFYTLADYALAGAGEKWPATSIAARGAAAPQDALREFLQAGLDADMRRVIELTPPTEAAALHDAGQVLVDANAGASPSGTKIVSLETTEQDVRGHTGLGLRSVVLEDAGRQLTITRAGDCLTIAGPDAPGETLCANDLASTVDSGLRLGSGSGAPVQLDSLVSRLAKAMLDLKVVFVEENGGWYVSPGQTLLQLYADVLGALTPQNVRDLLPAN